MSSPLLQVERLTKRFRIGDGVFRRGSDVLHAVDGLDFTVGVGETLGLVGESGCGKTTTGRILAKLTAPTEGRILLADDGEWIDVVNLGRSDRKRFRRRVQMIFQDPYESMNPRRTVFDTVAEPLCVQRVGTRKERAEAVADLLSAVGLTPPRSYLFRYPHELSGGQRQRVAIARALVVNPSFVIADEPTSMLDVSVRIAIVELMRTLGARAAVSYLFITHDLAIARYICDRIAVMYLGKIVELAPTEELLTNPAHPYTKALLAAVPVVDPTSRRPPVRINGAVTTPINPEPHCRFLDRCPLADQFCARNEHPSLVDLGRGHHVACHHRED
jgi:oligopeptide/dipeptide ABC transporter ATP-binding protein